MSLKLMRDVYAHAHSSQAKGCAACTPVGRAVLLAIIFHAGKDVRECWPSVDLLALETCVTTRSVHSALALLKSQGFISIEKRVGRGKTSIYRLNQERIAIGEPTSPIAQPQKVNQLHPIAPEKDEPNSPFESDFDRERVNVTTEKGERGSLKGERGSKPPDPLKGRTERTEKNRAPEIDASMAVSGLIDMTGLHSRDARVVLESMAREAEKKGEDLVAWAETLAKSWQLLEESRPTLEYHWSAAKFFGEGHYKNSNGWPWKQGQRPKPRLRAVNG